MRDLDLVRPASVEQAIAAWRPRTACLGGGTNLVDLIKIGVLTLPRLIDIARLPGLYRVERRAEGGGRRAICASAPCCATPI